MVWEFVFFFREWWEGQGEVGLFNSLLRGGFGCLMNGDVVERRIVGSEIRDRALGLDFGVAKQR